MNRSDTRIIAAIPCFNEEQFVSDTVTRSRKHVDKVVVIDDGSADNTVEVARAAGAEVLKHEMNKGYGETIRSCFDAARTNEADILVTLDGDGQHNPDEIPQVLAPILLGEADLVIGSRFLQSGPDRLKPSAANPSHMPRYRKFGIDVITFLHNFGAKAKVSDSQSGFRAYNRKVLDTLSLTEKGMAISIEILVQARKKGVAITEVPIHCTYHSQSSSLNPVTHGLGVAFSTVRLRLFSR